MKHVKFENKIRENIVDAATRQNTMPSMALVIKYDSERHTADIVAAIPGSEQLGERYNGIPCPQTNGVQGVAPGPGRTCWIAFPTGSQNNPIITAFFNPFHRENDYENQNIAINDTPRFMMDI